MRPYGAFLSFFLVLFSGVAIPQQAEPADTTRKEIVFPIKRKRPPNTLPEGITRKLNTQYPGWKFVDNYVIFEYTHPDRLKGYPFNPNLIKGDFDGNRQEDYALQISHSDTSGTKHLFIAFLAQGNSFKQHILESNPGYKNHYLWLRKKGSKGYNFTTEKHFRFPSDAIEIVVWEKGAISYVYKSGKFRKLFTSD